MFSFFIDRTSNCFYSFDWQVIAILTQMEDFVHRLTYFEPPAYPVVFFNKKRKSQLHDFLFFTFPNLKLQFNKLLTTLNSILEFF